tara:strand:+ start:173 stop:1240 length:1068 start_codon:yes stop_codon:yes gene_type:complete
MDIDIRLATQEEKKKLLEFLDNHWKKDHIYVKDIKLLEYLHLDQSREIINFVIIVDKIRDEILGIHAFIPYSHFDSELEEVDIFLSIWKVKKAAKIPALGLRSIEFIQKNFNARLIQAMGFIEEITKLYETLGFQVGYLSHHVLFNPKIENFKVARNVSYSCLPPENREEDSLKLLIGQEELLEEFSSQEVNLLCRGFLPLKSKKFLFQKYLNHPNYKYELGIGVNDFNDILFLFVFREIFLESSMVLRIVDFFGQDQFIFQVANQLINLLETRKAEYLDFYQYGLNNSCLEKAYFKDRGQFKSLIVPDHFEPFEERNIDINFAYRLSNKKVTSKVRFFKGDGDQDRPSLLRKNQ